MLCQVISARHLWLAANHKPDIDETSKAIWARVHLVPFTQTFSEESTPKIDKYIGAKLQKDATAILAWMVAGCLAWQVEGLKPPKAVNDATALYQDDSDPHSTFFAEVITAKDGATTLAKDVAAAYKEWGFSNQALLSTDKAIYKMIEEHGYRKTKGMHGQVFQGLALTSTLTTTPPTMSAEDRDFWESLGDDTDEPDIPPLDPDDRF